MKLFFSLTLIIILATPGISPAGAASGAGPDAFDLLREKRLRYLVGVESGATNPYVASRIASLNGSVEFRWRNLTENLGKQPYLFDAYQDTASSANMTGTMEFLQMMAQGYATPGCAYYHNQAMLGDIARGLDWMITNWYTIKTPGASTNWWDWDIGTPAKLNNIMVYLYDDLDPALIARAMAVVDFFSPSPLYCAAQFPPAGRYQFEATAANRLYMCMVVGLRGIIVKDEAKVTAAREGLSDTFLYVTSGDGFYADGSFIQHVRIPYTGAYGLVLLDMLSELLYMFDQSPYQVTDPNVRNVYDWVRDAFIPFTHEGIISDAVMGRASSRSYNHTYSAASLVKSVFLLSQTAPAGEAAFLKSVAKEWLRKDALGRLYADSNFYMLQRMYELQADPSIEPWSKPSMNRQFASMDRVVHSRPGYLFVLSAYSGRTLPFESILGENEQGWYRSEGMTYLYNSDLQQYANPYWNAINPYRIPGTTVDAQLVRASAEGAAYVTSAAQVGGASLDGLYGGACMELDAYNATLAAKKSWFMFDDEIVALGADINSTDNRTIETVIENRNMGGAAVSFQFTADGTQYSPANGYAQGLEDAKWMHLTGSKGKGSNTGYFFPYGCHAETLREARASGGDTRSFFNIWLDHGKNPAGAGYAYVLLPGKTAEQTAAYAAEYGGGAGSGNIEILANNAAVQAVRHNGLGMTGMTFWSGGAGKIDGLSCDSKASVMLRRKGREITLAVSDPTQLNTGRITVELGHPAGSVISADSGVEVLSLYPSVKLAVNVNQSAGKTYQVKLETYTEKNETLISLKSSVSLTRNAATGWDYILSEVGGVRFKAWTQGSAAFKPSAGGGFGVSQKNASNYQDHLVLSETAAFSNRAPTYIHIKYRVEAAGGGTPPRTGLMVHSREDAASAYFLNFVTVTPAADADGSGRTLRMVIDPVSERLYYSNDGERFQSHSFKNSLSGEIGDFRLYLTSQTGSGSGTAFENDLIWSFDSVEAVQYVRGSLLLLDQLSASPDGDGAVFSAGVFGENRDAREAVLTVASFAGGRLTDLRAFSLCELAQDGFSASGRLRTDGPAGTVKAFLWNNFADLAPIDRMEITLEASE